MYNLIKYNYLFSFCHPHTLQNHGISTFFRGIDNRTNVR
nr:MAG TPA: hypothetical protein [Bacteriophage sp.]DAZ80813.1 MAG TPA: hypothetical protein [Caudoviricetes sp.]